MFDKQIAIENYLFAFMPKEIEGKTVWVGIKKFIFTMGLVDNLQLVKQGTFDYIEHKGRWCYEDPNEAMLAMIAWSGFGDPPGPWIKYKGLGQERHNPELFERHPQGFWVRRKDQIAPRSPQDGSGRL